MFLKEEPMHYESFSQSRYSNDPNKRTDVLNVVGNLPPGQCMTLLAYFYGGLSIEEIATVMKIPAGLTDEYLKSACDKVLQEFIVADLYVDISDDSSKNAALNEIFNWYETEMITDERIQRVLEPILQMIKEGKFDQPRCFHKIGQ